MPQFFGTFFHFLTWKGGGGGGGLIDKSEP